MLLSNKRAKVIMSIIVIPIVVMILSLISPSPACNGKKEKVINKEKEYVTIVTNTPQICSGVSLTLNEDLKSSGKINVAEEKYEVTSDKEENLSTSSPVPSEAPTITPTAKPKKTKKPVKLASNGKPYKYYKVYDFYYGSNKYHKLDYKLQEYTYDLCIKYKIEKYYTLILCQLYYESQYKTDIISGTNDYGIAQINKCNHKWLSKELGITNFLNAKQSILCNIYLMSNNLKKYSVESSLFCYNTGSPNGSNTYSRNIFYMWNNGVRKIKE